MRSSSELTPISGLMKPNDALILRKTKNTFEVCYLEMT